MPTQTFTTSGSFTFPANYKPGSMVVQAWGEGGSGSNGASVHHGGGGGGGGEYAQDAPDGTAGSTVLTITIGTGGTATNTTVTGGTITVTAHAGTSAVASGNGAAGGSGSTNAVHENGGTGGAGGSSVSSNEGGGGGGGSGGSTGAGGTGVAGGSLAGGTGGTAGAGSPGGAAGGTGGAPAAGAGSNGNVPGSGGGGGGASGAGTGTGGTGAAGQVILTWSTQALLQDLPEILPGPIWFDLFKPGFPRPRPLVPFPPALPAVNLTGSFSLAPFAFSAQAGQSSPSEPGILPGPMWFDLFKPWLQKPRPPSPPSGPPAVSATGSFSFAPLAFNARAGQSSADIPQILPGPAWLDLFKPWLPRPRPPVPPAVTSAVNASGSFSLAPLAFSATANVIAVTGHTDFPQISPGPSWLALFKPWLPKRPQPSPSPGLTASGSLSLAPLAFSASASQSSPDVPQILPGPTWADLFKPQWPRPRQVTPPDPALPAVSVTGSFSLAPLAFSASAQAFFPAVQDFPQVFPGQSWLKHFKPGLSRPVPAPPALPAVSSSGSFALAPVGFTGFAGKGFLFIGHYAVSYPDYVDSATEEMLAAIPGQTYNMYVVSFRPGLPDPPLDGRWLGTPGIGDEVIFARSLSEVLAIARAHNAEIQAVNARKPYRQATGGTPVQLEKKTEEPSEASKATAAARAHNAELQARMARGEKI